jgi:hypothetical protein
LEDRLDTELGLFIEFQMKTKALFLVSHLWILALTVNSQTTISAGNVSGTWTKANSPYKVTGDIIVPKGSTLTIQPGVVVEFDGVGLTVDGKLNAVGKKYDSIVFKAFFSVWDGIVFYRNTEVDTILFNYCRFENIAQEWRAYNGKKPFDWRKSMVLVGKAIFGAYSSPLKVKNCSFIYNCPYVLVNAPQANAIYSFGAPLIVDSVYISSTTDKNPISQNGAMIGCDSTDYFSITNVKAENIMTYAYLIMGRDNIASVNRPSIIRNITGVASPKTILISIVESQYVKVENISTDNVRYTLVMDDSRDVSVKHMVCKENEMAFASAETCRGSILEDCLFERCGKPTLQPSVILQSEGPLFYNCQFKDNWCGLSVMQENGPGTPLFLNCNFNGTRSRAASIEGYPLFMNCNFTNSSDYTMANEFDENIPFTSGINVGREFYNSRPYFYNCLFWGNKDSFGHNNSVVLAGKVVKIELMNCIIQGDSSEGIVGWDEDNYKEMEIPAGNLTYINSNGHSPGFMDSAGGNFNPLNTCSQTAYMINRGMSGNLLTQYPFTILKSQYGIDIYKTTDLNGNPRVVDDTIDIGCYESGGTNKALKLKSTYRDTILCYGGSNTYTSSAFGAVQNYQWQRRTGSTITNISTAPSLGINDIRIYNQQYRLLVSNNECLPLKDSSAWFRVDINQPVKKGIMKSPNKDTIQLKELMQLSTAASGYQNFLWSNNATISAISFTGSSLGPKGTYRFTLEARKNNGCLETDTTYLTTKDDVGILTHSLTPSIQLYPQPAADILHIDGMDIANIQLFSMQGALIRSIKLEGMGSIVVKDLPGGIYFIELTSKEGPVARLKWLKE